MAELGDINFTDVNRGTSPVDRTQTSRAIAGALDVTKKVINEGIKAKVSGDMAGAIDEVVEDNTVVPAAPDKTEELIADPREGELARNIDRWKLQAEQGNSSQRTLAEMRIKEVLNEAQASFPWLVEELQGRAGLIISGSHELEELGLLDAARRSSATQAQNQLDDITTYANKKWEDGGLGMPPHLVIGDPQWIAQYENLDKLRQEQQTNARLIGITISRRDATAIEVEDAATLAMQGEFSIARAERHATFSNNGFDAALIEAQKGEGANLETLSQFAAVGVPVILDELEGQKIAGIQLYESQFAGILAGSPSGVRAKAMLDDFIAEQDSIINLFKASADNIPDALEQIAAFNGIRGAEVMRGMPEAHKNFVTFIGGPGKNLIEVAKLAKTADGLIAANQLGVQAVGILQGKFPTFLGPSITPANSQVSAFMTSGQNSISPSMSAIDINNQLDKIQRDSSSPWYVTTRTDKDELEAAFWSVDNHTKLWDAALSVPQYTTAQAAGQYLTGINNSLRAFNGIPEKPSDISEIIRTSLGDDRLLTAIDTVGDDPAFANQRRAFGASAKEWYESTKPTDRQEATMRAYNTTSINGLLLREVALVDIDAMSSDGTFNYIIREDRLIKKAEEIRARELQLNAMDSADTGAQLRTRSVQKITEDLRLDIVDAMEPIAKEVEQSITINRNLNAATSVNVESRRASNVKLEYFQSLGWLDAFNFANAETLN